MYKIYRNKETGKKVALQPKQYNPFYYEPIELPPQQPAETAEENRFNLLKKKGWINLSSEERREYKQFKNDQQ